MASRSARALVVELVADVTEFVKGTQKADRELGDFVNSAESDLEGLERDTKTTTRKMEGHFDHLRREAGKSFDKISTDADGADVHGKMGEFGAEAGAEFAQNMGEGISSGDFSGVATGTAGGLAASFSQMGPLGIVAGIGVGLAGVLFDSFLKKSKERAAATAQLVSSLLEPVTQAFEDALAETTKGVELQKILSQIGEGDTAKGMEKVAEAAGNANISVDELLKGLQEGDKGGTLAANAQKTADEAAKAAASVENVSKSGGRAGGAVGKAAAEAKKLREQADATRKAAEFIKTNLGLSADAARKTAVQTSIMQNAMDPAAADAAQLARNTGQAADSMHGASGDAHSMGNAARETATALATGKADTAALAANVRASRDALKQMATYSAQADRNWQAIARNSSTTASNIAASAGKSLGGRTII